MISEVEHQSSFYIERLSCQYLVPGDQPVLEALKVKLDSAIQDRLTRELATLLSRALTVADEGMWFIRRIEVNLDLNVAWESERLARLWALSIVRSLASILQADGNGSSALYFPSRSAYLAHFLLDLIQGTAWGSWYYAPFEGLRMLPLSAAVRTAICEDPLVGVKAMISLERSAMRQVLQNLNLNDARRVLALLSDSNSSAMSGTEPREALSRYLESMREAAKRSGVAESIANEDSAYTQMAMPQADQSLDWRIAAPVASHAPASLHVATPQAVFQRGSRTTLFGGAFLLLPMMASLNLEQVVGSWPSVAESSGLVALRFLLLLKCLGQANGLRALNDDLFRDLLTISPDLDARSLQRWQARLSTAQLDDLLFALKNSHFAPNSIEREEWILVQLPRLGGPVALLLDSHAGIWRFADRFSFRSRPILEQRLRIWLRVAHPDAVLRCDPALAELATEAWKGRQILALEPHARAVPRISKQKPAPESDAPIRREQLAMDLDYLTLPRELRGPAQVDLTLSVAAQNLLFAFSRRLPGFARSSLPYLYTNFLDFPASLEEESARRLVRMGRPPLALILNITGMNRDKYHLDWLDERPIALFPED
jgi:hypothetical protein